MAGIIEAILVGSNFVSLISVYLHLVCLFILEAKCYVAITQPSTTVSGSGVQADFEQLILHL